jgi:hypothetical protein
MKTTLGAAALQWGAVWGFAALLAVVALMAWVALARR